MSEGFAEMAPIGQALIQRVFVILLKLVKQLCYKLNVTGN